MVCLALDFFGFFGCKVLELSESSQNACLRLVPGGLAYIYIYIYACIYTLVRLFVHVFVYVYTYIYIHIRLFTLMYFIYLCVCICIYIYRERERERERETQREREERAILTAMSINLSETRYHGVDRRPVRNQWSEPCVRKYWEALSRLPKSPQLPNVTVTLQYIKWRSPTTTNYNSKKSRINNKQQ